MLMSPTEPGPAYVTEDSRTRKEGGKKEERKETLPRAVCLPCYVRSGVTEGDKRCFDGSRIHPHSCFPASECVLS